MNRIEEHIRKLLGQQSPPEDVDAEGLWADIAAGLPPEGEQAPGIVAPTSSRWIAGLLIGLALILFLAGSWWWLGGVASEVPPNTEAIATAEAPTAAFPEGPTLPTDLLADKATSPESKTVRPAALSVQKKTAKATTLPTQASKLPRKNGLRGNYAPPNLSTPDGTHRTDATGQLTGVDAPQEILVIPLPERQPSLQAEGVAVASNTFPVAKLQQRVTVTSLTFINELPATTLMVTDQKFAPTNRKKLSAGIHFGSNIMLRRFSSNGDDTGGLLNRATGQVAGQTAAINLRYHLHKNLAVNTGIEYARISNTFRYVSERDTLIPHPTPPNTSLINAIVRRTVAHNNEEHLIHIPLTIEYQQEFGDFTLGLGVGAGLNWQTAARGKTIAANGRVVTYEAPLQRPFFVSYQVQPRLTWQPNPERPWAFELRTDIRRFQLGVSPVTGTSQSGWLLGGGLGLRYAF